LKRLIVGITAALLLAATSAKCAEKPKIIPVMGGVKQPYTTIGRTIDSYCDLSSGRSLDKNVGLFITGINTCKPAYGSEKTFYEVLDRGKTYYIRDSDINIDEKDLVRLRAFSAEDAETHKKGVTVHSRLTWLEAVQASIKKLDQTGKHGITVVNYEVFDISEYTEGTGFRITFYNPTKKPIRYVTITYVGYNAVNDPVKDYRTPSGKLTLKGIGPIEPGTQAIYSEEYAWMTDVVETVKLTGITVEYMDRTKKVIKNPKVVTLDATTRAVLDAYNEELREEEDVKEAAVID